MTDSMLMLYWITCLFRLSSAVTILLFLAGAVLTILCIYLPLYTDEYFRYKREYIRTVIGTICALVILLFCFIFVPAKEDAMFIAGGAAVIEAAKSDPAQRLATKSISAVEKYLDDISDKEKSDDKSTR